MLKEIEEYDEQHTISDLIRESGFLKNIEWSNTIKGLKCEKESKQSIARTALETYHDSLNDYSIVDLIKIIGDQQIIEEEFRGILSRISDIDQLSRIVFSIGNPGVAKAFLESEQYESCIKGVEERDSKLKEFASSALSPRNDGSKVKGVMKKVAVFLSPQHLKNAYQIMKETLGHNGREGANHETDDR